MSSVREFQSLGAISNKVLSKVLTPEGYSTLKRHSFADLKGL